VQLPARYRIQHLRTRAAMVGKKLRAPLRKHSRLVLHILPATGQQQQCAEGRERKPPSSGNPRNHATPRLIPDP
jgi:hypothetical protein